MAIQHIQESLNAGEISPELFGLVSLEKYSSAATTLRNAFVNYRGGAISRGGLAFVGRCKQNPPIPPRAIPFQFSNNQGYTLEFGGGYVRFVFMGGYVLEPAVAITGVTNASPAVASLAGTPFSNGDWVFAAGVGGMTQLNGQTFQVAGAASGHLQLQSIWTGNPINSTAWGTYTSGGTLSRIYTIASPYAVQDLPYLKFSQSADVMSLTCSNPVTGNEYPPYDLARHSNTNWTLVATNFEEAISPPTNVSAVALTQAPSTGINATFAYQVTAIDKDGNESVASTPWATCNGADLQVEGGSNRITWTPVPGAKFYNIYRSPPATNTLATLTRGVVPAGSILGFVGSAYGNQFLDTQSVSDLQQTPPTHQNPFAPGQILAVDITNPGANLPATVTYSITTGTGSGFSGYPAVNGGALGGFLIQNGGKSYQPGDSIAFNGAGFASGAIEFVSTNPSAGDTITLNSVVWTFVSALTGPNQTLVQTALSATLAQLVSDLTASVNALITVAAYSVDITSSNLLVTYKTAGTAGNAYTLAASRATPSGGTLAGGTGSGFAGSGATGSITFTINLTNGQTIILDGVTWTFVTSGASGNQTNLGASLAATLTQLQLDLTASANVSIALANYSVTTTVLNIAYKTVGAVGNTYTLGAGTSGGTASGANLTGGADASSTPTGTLIVGPETGTYPGVNVYFQQRHFFANSLNDPDTVWATQVGLYQNMDTSIPTDATDAISATPFTEQVNGIQWLIAMPGGLIAMTGLRAWQLLGEGSYNLNAQPVTPATLQAQPQAFNGCSATVPPIVVDFDVLYVQAIGNTTVYDLSWNFWINIYTGNDLTILSSHLFLPRSIVQWAWARYPYKVVWCCCDDGTLLSLTYLKEQQVWGWARSDTQGLVVSVASTTEPAVNAIYAITERFPAL